MIVVFGSMARVSYEVVEILRMRGFKAGMFKPKTLWPMNYDILRNYIEKASIVIVPEMNLGQFIYDVKLVGGDKVYSYTKVGGGIPIYSSELIRYIMEVYKR